jgi:hypothetical protein
MRCSARHHLAPALHAVLKAGTGSMHHRCKLLPHTEAAPNRAWSTSAAHLYECVIPAVNQRCAIWVGKTPPGHTQKLALAGSREAGGQW